MSGANTDAATRVDGRDISPLAAATEDALVPSPSPPKMAGSAEAAAPVTKPTLSAAEERNENGEQEAAAAVAVAAAYDGDAQQDEEDAAEGVCDEEGEEDDEERDDDEEGEEEEEEEEEDGYDFEPEDTTTIDDTAAGSSRSAAATPLEITVGNRQYKPSAFVKNRGLSYVPGKLKSNPKATFEACTTQAPHSILDCQQLHLSNRAVLVHDRFIRLNMLVDNPAKEALLRNPVRSLKMRICRRVEAGHEAATCKDLHLRPDIVFVGIPGLRTAYFEAELRQNLALTKLKEEPWETQCGTWCRANRSHVVTTCSYVHYSRGDSYTEKPTAPHRPLAAIPDLTPSRPAQSTERRGRGGRGRGRGGRGGGRGWRGGGRGAGRGGGRGRGGGGFRGRGRGGRGAAAIPLPSAFQTGHVAGPAPSETPSTASAGAAPASSSGAATRFAPPGSAALAEPAWMSNGGEAPARAIDRWLLNILVLLLGVFVVLLAVALRRKE